LEFATFVISAKELGKTKLGADKTVISPARQVLGHADDLV
jgi:hypothetical protein